MADDDGIEPSRELKKYLVPQEKLIIKQRQHWIVVAMPVSLALAGLVLVGVIQTKATSDLNNWPIYAWLLLLVWVTGKLIFWWRDEFIATNKRLLKTYGIVTRKVAMMPMSKVTDMTYDRSVAGRFLGWGRFIVESAGQDQALSVIDHVVNPDVTYQKITQEIFAPSAEKKVTVTAKAPELPIAEPDEVWWRR